MPDGIQRNPLGSITPVTVPIAGRKAKRFDAKKRYTKLDGSPGRKFKRCRSYAEAQTQLINFRNEIESELAGETAPDIHTFFELCDQFAVDCIKPPVFVGDRQIAGYRQDLKTLRGYVDEFRAAFGNPDVRKLSYAELRRYAEKVATTAVNVGKTNEGPPKPATVNRKLAFLRRIFYYAIELQWLDKNPFKAGKKRLIDPGAEEPKDRALEFDEEVRLLAACEGPDTYQYKRKGKIVTVTRDVNPRAHLKPVIIFAIESGMRKKEIFTTRRPQLDFEKHVIELNPRQTKALKRRFIPMSDRLEAALRELLAARPFGRNDLIFDGLKDCDRAFATACRRAGIVGLTFHGLRHTAMTWMDEAGLSGDVRRNIGGHADRRTGGIYVNPTADSLNASRVKMNEFRQKQEERGRAAGGIPIGG